MSDENEVNLREIYDSAVEEGLDKNGIMTKLIEDGKLTVLEAVAQFRVLAKAAGHILSREERAAKADEILSSFDYESEDDVNDAVDMLCKELDIAPSTASERVRLYCKDKGIDLGTGGSRAKAPKEDVIRYIIQNEAVPRSDLAKGLMSEFGYKKGTADSFLAMLGYMQEYAKQMSAAASSTKTSGRKAAS